MGDPLDELNQRQRAAVEHDGAGPLLVIAGAGSGKTHTLAHRAAHLVRRGADPRAILLLTFSRRAAQEMVRRAERICARSGAGKEPIRWAGTFHAVGNRLLRLHARDVGLEPSFTVLDRGDAADLLDLLRHRLGLSRTERRFPRKETALAIYSRAVNASEPLARTLADHFPWCAEHEAELKRLFGAFVEEKQRQQVLDYDDLLLWWRELMASSGAERVRARFRHILVDEYQDTNALQAEVLRALAPDGAGLTVVGDDAQAIYAFRAATVRNILDFPAQFDPPAQVVTLVDNYRSTQPILDASNALIARARERYSKDLVAQRGSAQRARLVAATDETAQVDWVVRGVLARREAGVPLRKQAVLFRAAHHAAALEVELARRNVPFVKYGGLKFLEAAHVKDALAVLRWAENRRDRVAGFRVLQLLPGVGPAAAERALDSLSDGQFAPAALEAHAPPAAAREHWPPLCALIGQLAADPPWAGQLGFVRAWYRPHLERVHDHPELRAADLEQLEQIASQFPSRERFLSELTLDPPQATGDLAGPPLLDEDFLILSTIHSAKGQEWDAVYVLNVVDGCIPSDLATSTPEELEEERRLLYVAMTRARDELDLIAPLRFYVAHQRRFGDRHVYAPRCRFLADEVVATFEQVAWGEPEPEAPEAQDGGPAARLRARWQ